MNQYRRGEGVATKRDADIILYTLSGKEDYRDDNDNPVIREEGRLAYAKKQINPNSNVWRYFIRANVNNRLFNPMSPYNEEELLKNKMKTQWGGSYKYVEVDGNTFNFYLTFLRTKNKAFYLQAERGF